MSAAEGAAAAGGFDWGAFASFGAAVITLLSAVISAAAQKGAGATADKLATANKDANGLTSTLIGTVSDALRTSQTMQASEVAALRDQTTRLTSLEAKVDRLLDKQPGV